MCLDFSLVSVHIYMVCAELFLESASSYMGAVEEGAHEIKLYQVQTKLGVAIPHRKLSVDIMNRH